MPFMTPDLNTIKNCEPRPRTPEEEERRVGNLASRINAIRAAAAGTGPEHAAVPPDLPTTASPVPHELSSANQDSSAAFPAGSLIDLVPLDPPP